MTDGVLVVWARAFLLIGLFVVAACGGAEAERSMTTTSASASSTTTPPTTAPPTTTTTTLVPIPVDPVLAECQMVVNTALGEWVFDDDLNVPARCVMSAELGGNGGRYWAGRIDINAQLPASYVGELRTRGFRSKTAHELGHAWDVAHLTTSQRARYMALRGYTGDWYTSNAVEDYADVFSLLMSGLGDQTITSYLGTPGFTRSPAQIGERPSPEQVAAICAERLVPC